MAALIINPAKYMNSITVGLKLFSVSVLPALFPFFFFSKILTSLDVASSFGKAIQKPLRKIYNAPPITGYIVVMSMMSGYPLGAKLVSDCFSLGIIDENEAKSISTLASTSGPLFILGTIGASMLNNSLVGLTIILSHYIGALLNGLIYRNKSTSLSKVNLQLSGKCDNLLHDSINESILSILIVGGYIAVFNMILDVVFDLGLFNLISFTAETVKINGSVLSAITASFIEVTRGCFMISNLEIELPLKVAFLAGVVSFGGLSITLQSLTFLGKCKIGFGFYIKSKATHMLLAFSVALVLGKIFI